MARWLVHELSWGVLSTLDKATGEPMGGVASHSDGARGHASGRVFFYKSPMDELTQNILVHPNCTYTISEQSRPVSGTAGGPCGGLDPEDPACARATLVGQMLRVEGEENRQAAQEAVFSRHPHMADWPAGHKFDFFELRVSQVHVLDWYGGIAIVSADDYYGANPA